jgi:c-di-GMP-binding flagellar brake protein YcgR
VSSPFNQESGPQPPKVLKTPAEIAANMRQLQQNHDPLLITFEERSQRFQSYVVEVDRDKNLVIFDELVPNDGERFLLNGEIFNVEAFHDGVRVAWKCEHAVRIAEHEGARCYFSPIPSEITYHQRRSAFRAGLIQGEAVNIELSGDKLRTAIPGQLLDISATGCKLRFPGNISSSMQAGQVYERLTLKFPFGTVTTAIEVRHVQYGEKVDATFVGVRFHRINGQEQRQVERIVYQLQREARRVESDGLF